MVTSVQIVYVLTLTHTHTHTHTSRVGGGKLVQFRVFFEFCVSNVIGYWDETGEKWLKYAFRLLSTTFKNTIPMSPILAVQKLSLIQKFVTAREAKRCKWTTSPRWTILPHPPYPTILIIHFQDAAITRSV